MFYIAVNHIYRWWWVTLIFRSKVITQACVFKHEFVWIALFLSFLLDCNEAATAAADVWWLRMTYSPPLCRCLYCIWINIGFHFDIEAHDEDESFKNYWEMRGFITSYWWCTEHAHLMPLLHTHIGLFFIHLVW